MLLALQSLVVLAVLAWGGFGIWIFFLSLVMVNVSSLMFCVCLLLGPLAAVPLSMLFSDSIRAEADLVRRVGEEAALWTVVSGYDLFTHPAKRGFKEILWMGHDQTGDWLAAWVHTFHLPQELQDMIGKGSAVFGSILWSRFILWCEKMITDLPSGFFSVAAFVLIFRKSISLGMFAFQKFFLLWCTFFVFLYHVPPEVFFRLLFASTYQGVRLVVGLRKGYYEPFEWLKWRVTSIVVEFVCLFESVNSEFQKRHSLSIARGSTRLSQHFKTIVMRATVFISDVNLPSFVRRRFKFEVSREVMEESMQIMRDLGWPINTSVADPHPIAEEMGFKEWLLCGTDFATGIHNLKLKVDKDLETLRLAGATYKRSEEFASTKNELESLSRYFASPTYDFPDLDLDDVWYVVGDIFRHSRLTTFNHIIHMWEKKYALGAFMKDPTNAMRKYKRSKFIRDIGGMPAFKALWAATFRVASLILPVSAVSVKGEALPERKWAKDMVRTVVGSPITQYIMSTIWNYGPNHRFAWQSTPIKIGMPLNGYWMSTVWEKHSRCQIHVEGDFEKFDSTISGKIKDLVKAVRKKGFEGHKDRDRIAELIDYNYEQVSHQLLQTTSTGNVYLKGTGLTTGHSSTSMDNSVSLVIIYLMAWKDVTGLSAREFMYYNELSCFGDDHVLSILASRPAVWTAKNIRSSMKKWGLTNNLEVKKSLQDVSFLSKWGRRATPREVQELKSLGVNSRFLVWHDKSKLVGKLLAPVKNQTPSYRLKRMLSYLTLTAHHPDIYDGIVKVICSSKGLLKQLKNDKLVIPSYRSIMKNWYSPSPGQVAPTEDVEEFQGERNNGQVVQYGEVTALDAIFGAASMLPDLLSPLLFNFGYMRALQVFLKSRLNWIVDLICLNNSILSLGQLSEVIKRTPYRFLEVPIFLPGFGGVNDSTLLVRHWLFCLYAHLRPKVRFGAWFNFVLSRVNSLQFIINGKVNMESRENEIGIDLLIVATLLSLVSVPDWFSFLGKFSFPDLQLLVDSVIHYATVTIWRGVPPNFRETTPTLRSFSPRDGPIAISAPTGSGKSTGLVQHIEIVAGHRFHKVIVIEPRTLLVHGLVNYMQSSFGLDCSGSTTGMRLDRSKKVLYMTPQALFQHVDLLNHNNLFVLDEAHINDINYSFLRELFIKSRLPTIFLSATVPEDLSAQCQYHLEIPMANLWTTTETIVRRSASSTQRVLQDYERYLLDLSSILTPNTRALCFVPTRQMAEKLASSCGKKALSLTGGKPMPENWNYDIVFATPVADVGVTIPDVTLVVSPNFTVLDESGTLLQQLDDLTRKQRRGRTGRTCNGEFRLVQYDHEFGQPAKLSCFTPVGVQQLLLSGVPPKLMSALSAESVIRAFGVTPPEDEDVATQMLRDVEVFINNFRPVFLSQRFAIQEAETSVDNNPFVFHSTGLSISSSFPQIESRVQDKVVAVVSDLLRARSSRSKSENFDDLVTGLDRMAGPILKVKNLVNSLLEGEMTDMLNPKNGLPTGLVEDVYALKDIAEILKSLENVT